MLEEIFLGHTFFTGNDDLCKYFSEEISKEFEMSLFGEIKFFVGLQIQQKKDGVYISQYKNMKEILKKFGMEDSRPVGTPISTGHKLSKNDDSKEVYSTTYRSIIGMPITLVVAMVAIFLANPKENHMMITKRIMRYQKGTEDYGLQYKKGGNLDLKAFTKSDWVP